jgi:tyrosyl-tRNA synthetase
VVDFNSRWLGTLDSLAWIRLASRYNVAQMLERRDFKQRYEQGRPIALHEFLYPLGQGYDSVHLKADVELGGTDQLFNLNVGRDIMPSYDLEAQVVMTTPLLEGLDGVEKMSKSLNNYVGMTDSPGEMFGKLMSISDTLMWRYYLLLTDLSRERISALEQQVASGALHPKQAKVDLARLVVGDFHSGHEAEQAAEAFEARFARGELAVDALPTVEVVVPEGSVSLARLIVDAGLAMSTSEATRKVQQGGVRVDRERATDARTRVAAARGTVVLEVGRRSVRVTLR